MSRIYVYCEGQTEETFVRDVLGPHLWGFDVYVTAILAATKVVKRTGQRFKGGIVSYQHVKRDLRLLFRDQSMRAVTTMIDYYGLPEDFPGLTTKPVGTSYDRVAYVEAEFEKDIAEARLVPYLSLHEFEAMMFVSPETTATVLMGPGSASAARLAGIAAGFPGPEEIDDGPTTAPSKRILEELDGYRKPLHGPLITSRVGLDAIRAVCPHLNEWLTKIEALGGE